jgi:hypothetical protein
MGKPYYRISSDPDYYEKKARRMALLCAVDCTNNNPVNRSQFVSKVKCTPPLLKPVVAPAVRSNIINCTESVTLNWN